MDAADILTWVAEQRAAAELQRQRWQGVDPSRLLHALDLIEQLLQRPGEAAPAGVPIVVLDVQVAPTYMLAHHLSLPLLAIEGVLDPVLGSVDERMTAFSQLGRLYQHKVLLVSQGRYRP